LGAGAFAFKFATRGRLQERCRACQAGRARQHYLTNRGRYLARVARNNTRVRAENRARLQDYLTRQRCLDCGVTDLAVLEFDHRAPEEKWRDVSDLVRSGGAWSTVLHEIAKCDVVCANCHRRRTARQFGWHKLTRPQPPSLPELPLRGSPDYERIKSVRSGLARRHRNRLLVWEYLENHPCARCGLDDPLVLEFDHLRDKARDIGWLMPHSGHVRLLAEIVKCRVLCANCHRQHTARQNGRQR